MLRQCVTLQSSWNVVISAFSPAPGGTQVHHVKRYTGFNDFSVEGNEENVVQCVKREMSL